jgi:hypothetical protein
MVSYLQKRIYGKLLIMKYEIKISSYEIAYEVKLLP